MTGAVALFAAVVAVAFRADMREAHERVRGKSAVVATALGDIEFADGGSGYPVLIVHGSGGGFDQGELIAKAVLGEDFRWIAPSRFGYLRSDLPEGATWDDQADAYAGLLDRLNVDEVAVVAMSQGGPSALLFALQHPERVSSLVLISCGVAASADRSQMDADRKGDALTTIFRYDFAYWVVTRVFRRQLMKLIGATDDVIAGLSDDQEQLFDRFIDYMNPASLRSAGVSFDNRARMPDERIAAIEAPTLILHATDDTLQLFRNAEFAEATIPDSRLVRFEHGGHFLIGAEQAAIRGLVQGHVRRHADAKSRR